MIYSVECGEWSVELLCRAREVKTNERNCIAL